MLSPMVCTVTLSYLLIVITVRVFIHRRFFFFRAFFQFYLRFYDVIKLCIACILYQKGYYHYFMILCDYCCLLLLFAATVTLGSLNQSGADDDYDADPFSDLAYQVGYDMSS